MKARNWIGISLATLLTATIIPMAMGDDSRPSDQTLAQMGLGGMAVMSDHEAMNVRGHGYRGHSKFNYGKGSYGKSGKSSVSVFGNSFATYNTPNGSSHSENGYSSQGSRFAKGSNFSEAGVEFTKSNKAGGTKYHGYKNYGGGKPHGGATTTVKSIRVFAGGYSSAKAF